MIYELSDGKLIIKVSDAGAELQSVQKEGVEYLWQGNPEFWGGRAYNLFPICGRLTESKYTYKGKTYEMNLHGFFRKSVAECKAENNSLTFSLRANEKTFAMYPFDFEYSICYTLEDESRVKMDITVKNNGDEVMPFALGGHPGFNVPLADGEKFEDYYLDFCDATMKTIYMSDTCYTTRREDNFILKDGHLHLRHYLFDRDAILLSDAPNKIVLRSDEHKHGVTVDIPSEMKYVGIWHAPKKEAPYVCIEPWTSVPAYDGEVDDLETKRDMFALLPGATYKLTWSISVF